MKIKRSRPKFSPSLDITPLLDVVFLLLVFLLVTMTFTQTPPNPTQEAIVDIELARASSVQSDKPPETVTVLVNEKGLLFLDNNPTPLLPDNLRLLLSERLLSAPRLAVNVRADRRATHGQVIEALDLLKSLHIEHVNLVIELTRE